MPPKNEKIKLSDHFKNIVFSSQGFPIILTLAVISILFVIFRMQSIEIDYKINDVKKDISKAQQDSKDLSAKKAKELSVKKLRGFAKEYDLKEPKQDQIIVIP